MSLCVRRRTADRRRRRGAERRAGHATLRASLPAASRPQCYADVRNDGQCVTYDYEFDGDTNASLFLARLGLAFQPRADLVAEVDDQSGLSLCGAGAPPCTGGLTGYRSRCLVAGSCFDRRWPSLAVVVHDPLRCDCLAFVAAGARRCWPACSAGARPSSSRSGSMTGTGAPTGSSSTCSPSASRRRWPPPSCSTCWPARARWRSASAPVWSWRRARCAPSAGASPCFAATASSCGCAAARASARSCSPPNGRADRRGARACACGACSRRRAASTSSSARSPPPASTSSRARSATSWPSCRTACRPSPRSASPVLEAELGADFEEVFAEFDWEPLAAASIGQTYAARLHTGEPVVVKVQRPGIEEMMERDLAALALLADLAQRRTPFGQGMRSGEMLAQFAQGLRAELDFRREADAMAEMAAAPRTTLDRCASPRSTAICRAGGCSCRSASRAGRSPTPRPRRADVDRAGLADQLLRVDARPGHAHRSLPRRPASRQRLRARRTARSGSSTSAPSVGSTDPAGRHRRHPLGAHPARREPAARRRRTDRRARRTRRRRTSSSVRWPG